MFIGERFVMTLKNVKTPEGKAKIRFVYQGCEDRDNPHIVHDTYTLHTGTIRLVLSIVACFNFKLFSHDVTHPHLQR